MFLGFSNLKSRNGTAGVTIIAAKAGRVKSASFLPRYFGFTQFSLEKRIKGSLVLVLVSWLQVYQKPDQLMSVFRSMKRVWETFNTERYNYFPCGLAKRQEEVLPFGNILLYFLIFIQTWEFSVKWKYWEQIINIKFCILNRVPKATSP